MIGATPITAVLGAAPPADSPTETLTAYVRALTGQGLAVLYTVPGGKVCVDLRSVPQRRKDDEAAREEAKRQDRVDWATAQAKGGLHLATTDKTKAVRYLTAYRKRYGEEAAVNFAVEVGRSRVVVVDCDTAEQVRAFLTFMGVEDAEVTIPPTVSTPGAKDPLTGEWVHRDGGHFWFTLPDGVELPDGGAGSLTHPVGGWALLWRDRYVLIPPSVREEGGYTLTGHDYPLPPALRLLIEDHVQGRVRRAAERAARQEGGDDLAAAVDAWAASAPWSEVLAPLGWVETGRPDKCGCPVWTAPGAHHSPKSATAHEAGCAMNWETGGNAPLHIWTDNPGPPFDAFVREHGKTVTRLQAAALASYDGDVAAAVEHLGIVPDKSFDYGINSRSAGAEDLRTSHAGDDFGLPGGEETTEEDHDEPADPEGDGILNPESGSNLPRIAPFYHWRDMPPPEYAVDGLIEHRALSCIIGAPGVGKSTVALDIACALATGARWQGREVIRQRVLYLPGEGLSGAVQRIRAWEAAHSRSVGNDLLIGDAVLQVAAPKEDWSTLARFILRCGVGMIVFDTFARMSVGMEENSATEVGKAIRRFDQLRGLTQAGVLVVHHTARGMDHGRGSSALNGALDSELIVEVADRDDDAPGKALQMRTTKQKNAEMLEEPIPLLLRPAAGSVVVTGPSGEVGDPFSAVSVPRAVLPEPVVELCLRLRAAAQRFTAQGLTRGDFVAHVKPDPYTRTRRNAEARWKRVVAEAVDLGLRYGVLLTLTGAPSGARYVPGPLSDEDARQRAADEALSD